MTTIGLIGAGNIGSQIAALDDESTTTSELLQAHLPKSFVVKAFNHIHFPDITTDGLPRDDENRRGLIAASNDQPAPDIIAALLDAFGFDAVRLHPLSEGRARSATPLSYVQRLTAPQLRTKLAQAKRYRDL